MLNVFALLGDQTWSLEQSISTSERDSLCPSDCFSLNASYAPDRSTFLAFP